MVFEVLYGYRVSLLEYVKFIQVHFIYNTLNSRQSSIKMGSRVFGWRKVRDSGRNGLSTNSLLDPKMKRSSRSILGDQL